MHVNLKQLQSCFLEMAVHYPSFKIKLVVNLIFLFRDIRLLCNTTHGNEQYVPITGHRRQYYTTTNIKLYSLGHHRPSP